MEYTDIIMPVYNCEKYIKESIESVKKQRNKNWRLIIIDDLSTDNTIQEINNSIRDIKEKVLLLKSNKHNGVAKTRNIGIKESTNKYIAFLDADDKWKEDKLEKQIAFMRNNKYSFTYTQYTYLKDKKEKEVKVFPNSLNYNQALKNTYILTSTVMIDTTQISKEYIYMPNVESEDTATWWNVLKKGYTANGVKENLTIYRIRKEGLSSNKFKNLKRTWNLYRRKEKLSLIKTMYYFINYIINAIKKRIY